MSYDVSNLSPPSVKDKAEILLQVEELLHIKEELSSQVCFRKIKIMREERVCEIFLHLCAIFCI